MVGSLGHHTGAECVMEGRLEGLRILVVDDFMDQQVLLACILEQYGASVVTASSTEEAVELNEQLRPNVLVSDICMPEHDGYELIQAVREAEQDRAGKVPAIAVTGLVSVEEHIKAINAGFTWYLPRPFEPEELVLAICRLVGR
jgi:CheY-like chemotaxis protein